MPVRAWSASFPISWFLPELNDCSILSSMSSRILALRHGKTGDVQRFSLARPVDLPKQNLLREAILEDTNSEPHAQILSDPLVCYQFACRWGDLVGFLTKPTIVTTEGDNPVTLILASFSDTIGQSFPVSVPIEDFLGAFTTRVTRSDAEQLRLSVHPTAPATVPGPLANTVEIGLLAISSVHYVELII